MKQPDDATTEIQAHARAWLLRLRSGDATPDDAQAFKQWCEADPAHARAVHALGRTWTTLDAVMDEITAEDAAAASEPALRAGRMRLQRPGRRAFAGFAVAAGASWLALRPPLHLWPAMGDIVADLAADYRTGTGEQRSVALSERVVVDMNTQTRINILSAQGAQHGIDLLAGEADIVAATLPPDRTEPARPVVVVAGRGRLQAQVARFDVRRVGNEVCVTCVSGSVAFEHPQQRLTLSAAQQLIYDDRNVRPVSSVDTNVVTAWRRGALVFRGVPLAQVVDEINRYRPGKLILRNTELRGLRVHAQFSIGKLDDAVALICKYAGAHATQLPGNIVLLS